MHGSLKTWIAFSIFMGDFLKVAPFSGLEYTHYELLQRRRVSHDSSYRIEPLATGWPLGSVRDALCSSCSQPAGHPAGNTMLSILLQHLRRNTDKRSKERFKDSRKEESPNYHPV